MFQQRKSNLQYFQCTTRGFNYANRGETRECDIPCIPITRHWPDQIYYHVCVSMLPRNREHMLLRAKFNTARPQGAAQWTCIYRRRWAVLPCPRLTSPCLTNATRVAGKRLANAILARIQIKARGYGTDFRVKAKHPYGLVARARLRVVYS